MSRLDSVIRRLMAQRDCLAAAALAIVDRPGPVLEIGLGNGRTYDHLRTLLPNRDIWVFDRQLACHPDCVPPADRLFLGDLRTTLDRAASVIGQPAALAHMDIGSGDEAVSRALAAEIAVKLGRLMADGGIVASDQSLSVAGWDALPLPVAVPAGRYFLYQVSACATP